MKNRLLFVCAALVVIWAVGCGSSAKVSNLPNSKEAKCIEGINGKDFKYLAWGIGKNNEDAEKDALKCALWAALVGGGGGSCISLLNAQEREASKEFVESLFADGGDWTIYVRSSNAGRIDPDKRLKLSDGRIKLGVEAIVAIKQLREDLQQRGILRSMKIGG